LKQQAGLYPLASQASAPPGLGPTGPPACWASRPPPHRPTTLPPTEPPPRWAHQTSACQASASQAYQVNSHQPTRTPSARWHTSHRLPQEGSNKAGSLEKINKIDRPLTNLTKMRREKPQISKIRNPKGNITNTMEIHKIIKDYFENLYSNKFENLEEIDRFLDTYDHPKLKQEDINHLNRS
jgi:hypothetical protein